MLPDMLHVAYAQSFVLQRFRFGLHLGTSVLSKLLHDNPFYLKTINGLIVCQLTYLEEALIFILHQCSDQFQMHRNVTSFDIAVHQSRTSC